jgi:hypothetical protein
MKKRVALAWMAVGALIVIGAVYGYSRIVAQPPGQVLCSANPCRITMTHNGADGLVIQDAHGPRVENPLLIIDPNGLAEFWQNAAGAYEGPKGEICTTDQVLAPVACLGSNGRTGWVRVGNQVLTAADIAWLHQAERSAQGTGSPAGPGHLDDSVACRPVR